MSDEQRNSPTLLRWLRREDFWYDTFKSVTSTSIAALILYLFAALAGYVRAPETRVFIILGAMLFVFILSIIWIMFVGTRGWDPRFRRVQLAMTLGVMSLVAALVVYSFYDSWIH